jgi:hypothetical protein
MLAEAELARGDLDTSPPSYASTARRPTRRPRSLASSSATRARSRASMRACARRSARSLSRARAWSAALLLGGPALYALPRVIESPRAPGTLIASVIAWVGVLAALALRQRWARPLALGFAATPLLFMTAQSIAFRQLPLYDVTAPVRSRF